MQVLQQLSGSIMFFGCFAWNGVNFMFKSSVRQGSVYVGAMALRCDCIIVLFWDFECDFVSFVNAMCIVAMRQTDTPLSHFYIFDQIHFVIIIVLTMLSSSFVAAITVVAWSSFIQVENKILEKHCSASVGCREAFRRKTTPVFLAAVFLFGVSVVSFVIAFIIIGYIKPCMQFQFPRIFDSHSTFQGVQTADVVQIDFIKPHLLKGLPLGTRGLVNRLANRMYMHIHSQPLPVHMLVCLRFFLTGFSVLGRD
jgi:hypothetical protein